MEIESNVARVAAPGQPERTSTCASAGRSRAGRTRGPGPRRGRASSPAPGAARRSTRSSPARARTASAWSRSGDFDWVVRAAARRREQGARPDAHHRGPRARHAAPRRSSTPRRRPASPPCQRKDPASSVARLRGSASAWSSREFQAAWTARDLHAHAPVLHRRALRHAALLGRGVPRAGPDATAPTAPASRGSSWRASRATAGSTPSPCASSATGLDYVVRDGDGHVVRGSTEPRAPVHASTGRSSAAPGASRPTRTRPECPSCGAPLAIGMAGDCRYCKAKVTTGEFDWVLSRIEQDEAYTGG